MSHCLPGRQPHRPPLGVTVATERRTGQYCPASFISAFLIFVSGHGGDGVIRTPHAWTGPHRKYPSAWCGSRWHWDRSGVQARRAYRMARPQQAPWPPIYQPRNAVTFLAGNDSSYMTGHRPSMSMVDGLHSTIRCLSANSAAVVGTQSYKMTAARTNRRALPQAATCRHPSFTAEPQVYFSNSDSLPIRN